MGLVLAFAGVFAYIFVTDDLGWYRTELVGAREVWEGELGQYVRVEGRFAVNASKDVIIVQEEVEKAVWTSYEYNHTVPWVWMEDERGDPLLVLFGTVSDTKPGRHGGDYHRGDEVCIGGTVAEDGSGVMRLRADVVAKYPEDTPARYAQGFVASAFAGMMLVLVFVLARIFLRPRQQEAPDWRGI